jgi:tripartite motif-containing protein 9/67
LPSLLNHIAILFSYFAAPAAPAIIPEECSAENNSVTVAWQPPPTSYVEGYVLELDDGCGGDFRVSSARELNIL